MNWFRNWKIRTKILSLVVLMALLIGTVGFIGYYYNTKANAELTAMYSYSLKSVENLNDARAQSRAGESALFHYLLTQDKATQQNLLNEMKKRSANFDESYSYYLKLATDSYEKERVQKIDKEFVTYRAERQKAIDIQNQGDPKGAYEYFTNNAQSHLDSINVMLEELADFNVKKADEAKVKNNLDNAVATKIIIALPIIATFLGLVIGYLIANLIAYSIKKVLTSVERVATGDLSVADVVIKDRDEVGQLATSFNKMKGNLHELVKHVAQSSEQVAASSEELNAITEESTQAANQIASSIEKVAQGTEKQAGEVDRTSFAIEQISASTQEAAASGSEITDSMAKTLTTTQAGQKALDRVAQQMNSISEGTDIVQHRINELSTSSDEIGNIVQFITGIADQTNLLALNAAIEAARAGEHGRGFAVVAEEVRKLAEQSREATTQIAALIHQNHSNIGSAVTAMEDEVKNVKEGIEVVKFAGQSFSEIAKLVESVSAQMEEISATIQQIASGTQQIVTSVERVDITSKETASQAQAVSAGVEEQTASMEQIALSTQGLATMASDLQNVISKFVI